MFIIVYGGTSLTEPHPLSDLPTDRLYGRILEQHSVVGDTQKRLDDESAELRDLIRHGFSRPDFSVREAAKRLDLSTQRVYQIAGTKRSEIEPNHVTIEQVEESK